MAGEFKEERETGRRRMLECMTTSTLQRRKTRYLKFSDAQQENEMFRDGDSQEQMLRPFCMTVLFLISRESCTCCFEIYCLCFSFGRSMWKLIEEPHNGPNKTYFLIAGTHEIGRSPIRPADSTCSGWISLPGDRSISRNHAVISVHELIPDNDLETEQFISIRDISKFGVSLDSTLQSLPGERKIKRDEEVQLKHGCCITFGVNNSRMRLEREHVVVCFSRLCHLEAEAYKACRILGFHVAKSWLSHTRMLIVNEVNITSKVLWALVDQKDILSPAYLQSLINRENLSDPFPDPLQKSDSDEYLFIPKISEMIPLQFHRFLAPGKSHNPEFNLNRRSIFNNVIFLYIESNRSSILNGKEIKALIARAGGIVQICNSQDVERCCCLLLSKNTVYIAQEEDDENLPAISRFLKANNVNSMVEVIHIFYAIISADVNDLKILPVKDSRLWYEDVPSKSRPGKKKEERKKGSGREACVIPINCESIISVEVKNQKAKEVIRMPLPEIEVSHQEEHVEANDSRSSDKRFWQEEEEASKLDSKLNPAAQSSPGNGVVNFKRFKKVVPTYKEGDMEGSVNFSEWK